MASTDIPSVRSLVGHISAARRWHPDTDTTALEQDVVVSRIVECARKAMADAPALTQGHIDTITAALTTILTKKEGK